MTWKRKDYEFCRSCGSKLVQSPQWIESYREQTGEAIYRYKLYCPKYGFFNLKPHFKEVFEGEDMIVELFI